jgi:hypothetical protein
MISAVEALALPTALLTDEELKAADNLVNAIEHQIHGHMRRNGVTLEGTESRPHVIAEVNQRLKEAGYEANWQLVFDQHPLNKALTRPAGYKLGISPTDESYRAAARAALS